MKQQTEKQVKNYKNLSGGLELLVQLAEKGEIDPWDVDIIEVTDKYLAELNKTNRENLLNAGRAIFYASVLLRMKSEILLNISSETLLASREIENFFPEDALLFSEGEFTIDPARLESYIVRSSIGKLQRKRKIVLGDLITALQQAEEEEEKRALRAKLRTERVFSIADIEAPENIFELAHEEDIDDIVEKVEAIIQEHLIEEKPITLSFLNEVMNNKTDPFLALLFLVHSQKIVIQQKEFYGEIYIYKAGAILEEPIIERLEEKKETIKSKKGIVDKIKEKIKNKFKRNPKKKVIEVISDKDQIIDLTTKEITTENKDETITSEVTSDGIHN